MVKKQAILQLSVVTSNLISFGHRNKIEKFDQLLKNNYFGINLKIYETIVQSLTSMLLHFCTINNR